MEERMRLLRNIAFSLAIAMLGFTTSGTNRAAAAEPLRIIVSSTPSFTYLPFLVASKVTFPELEKKLGRKIQITYAPTTSPAVIALLAGDQDIGIMYVQHAIAAQAEGKDLVVLASLMRTPTVALLARTDLPNIKSPADLKGKIFGVVDLGSGHHLIGLGILKAYHINPADVTFRSTGGVAGWIPAMRSKRVDVMLASEPTVSKLLSQHLGRIILDLFSKEETDRVFGGEFPTVAIVARRDYVKQHPDVVKAFVDNNLEALKWIHSHSAKEIAAALPEKLKDTPNVDGVLGHVIPAVSENGKITKGPIQLTIDLMKQMGELPKNSTVSPEQVIDDRFVK
ncbi:MAG TPA: ABC transporter substrate-binding protein [Nitrospira sp.]|nr:ABC transporter substrate-binding protein [Nitrospira sp.]